MYRNALLALIAVVSVVSVPSPRTALADFTVRNLSNNTMYLSQAYWNGADGMWVSEGWWTIASGNQMTVSANRYIWVEQGGTDQLAKYSGKTGTFYLHPKNVFNVMTNNGRSDGQWYISGTRVPFSRLAQQGYKVKKFKTFSDGSVLNLGSYYKIASVTKSFSWNSSGAKSQSFSHFNNTIIGYQVSVSSSRGVTGGPYWTLASNRKSVSVSVSLQGGPFYDPWRPSYKGSVVLTYLYH